MANNHWRATKLFHLFGKDFFSFGFLFKPISKVGPLLFSEGYHCGLEHLAGFEPAVSILEIPALGQAKL